MENADDGNVSVSFTCSEFDVLDYKMNAEFKDSEGSISVEDWIAKQIMVEMITLKNGH